MVSGFKAIFLYEHWKTVLKVNRCSICVCWMWGCISYKNLLINLDCELMGFIYIACLRGKFWNTIERWSRIRHQAGGDPWRGFKGKRERFAIHLIFPSFGPVLTERKKPRLMFLFMFIFTGHTQGNQPPLSRSVHQCWRFNTPKPEGRGGGHVLHIHVSRRVWTCNTRLGHRQCSFFTWWYGPSTAVWTFLFF